MGERGRIYQIQGNIYMINKSINIGIGERCKKCHKLMSRRKHPDHWIPTNKQTYYFEYWDWCNGCRFLQHYEKARRKSI